MENNEFQFPDERRVRMYDIKDGEFIQSTRMESGLDIDIVARIEPSDLLDDQYSLMLHSQGQPPSVWLPELYHYLKLLTLLTDET